MGWNNGQVPLEALLKYVVKERDKYKEKMELVSDYAKRLEKDKASLQKEVESLRKQVSMLSREVTKTPIYQGLNERYIRVKRDKETLILQIAKLQKKDD